MQDSQPYHLTLKYIILDKLKDVILGTNINDNSIGIRSLHLTIDFSDLASLLKNLNGYVCKRWILRNIIATEPLEMHKRDINIALEYIDSERVVLNATIVDTTLIAEDTSEMLVHEKEEELAANPVGELSDRSTVYADPNNSPDDTTPAKDCASILNLAFKMQRELLQHGDHWVFIEPTTIYSFTLATRALIIEEQIETWLTTNIETAHVIGFIEAKLNPQIDAECKSKGISIIKDEWKVQSIVVRRINKVLF